MKHIAIIIASVVLAMAGMSGAVSAQSTNENVSATNGNAATMGTGDASAAPGTVTRGTTGGTALLGPDGAYHVTEITPPSIDYTAPPPAPAAAPEPVYEEPVYEEPVDTTVADAAATDADLDADNLADDLEWELGLDPSLADTDGDGVADGDELNIYGTDATVWDSDGDGVADGEELFGSQTDPLVWDDFSATSDTATVEATETYDTGAVQ